MDISKLKAAIEISKLLDDEKSSESDVNCMIGKKVIIRTYAAGVWYGLLFIKNKDEVILKNARMLWSWKAKEGIALSGVARYGVRQEESRIELEIDSIWLQAIQIMPVTDEAKKSIEGCKNAAP